MKIENIKGKKTIYNSKFKNEEMLKKISEKKL